MKKAFMSFAVLVALTGAAAVAQDARYNFDKDTDFSKFKTYKWVEIKNSDHVDQIVEKQITAALDSELASKGLTKTDADEADLYIAYQTAVGTEKQFNSYQSSWGYGPGWRGGWYGGGMGSTMTTGSTTTIYVGQLAIDIYDTPNKDLVWRGVASKTIDPKAKPEKQSKSIQKAVTKLLKNYPPQK